MPALRARSTAHVSEDNRETALLARPPPSAPQSYRPINGLLALSERPGGVIVLTTLVEVLSRISGSTHSTEVCLGQYLRDLCQDIGKVLGGSSGHRLTCVVADAPLPIGIAVSLRLIADLLITNAFVYAFPSGRLGWIAVSFTAGPEAWQLSVEDRGIAMRANDRRDHGLTIARLLVVRHDGQLETVEVAGGTRCIVTIPRVACRA